uniref:Uncharacterized protein n=1 Tax=Anopheles stephensi TaxID=30069 RepID=A0A182YJ68_ANOST
MDVQKVRACFRSVRTRLRMHRSV